MGPNEKTQRELQDKLDRLITMVQALVLRGAPVARDPFGPGAGSLGGPYATLGPRPPYAYQDGPLGPPRSRVNDLLMGAAGGAAYALLLTKLLRPKRALPREATVSEAVGRLGAALARKTGLADLLDGYDREMFDTAPAPAASASVGSAPQPSADDSPFKALLDVMPVLMPVLIDLINGKPLSEVFGGAPPAAATRPQQSPSPRRPAGASHLRPVPQGPYSESDMGVGESPFVRCGTKNDDVAHQGPMDMDEFLRVRDAEREATQGHQDGPSATPGEMSQQGGPGASPDGDDAPAA